MLNGSIENLVLCFWWFVYRFWIYLSAEVMYRHFTEHTGLLYRVIYAQGWRPAICLLYYSCWNAIVPCLCACVRVWVWERETRTSSLNTPGLGLLLERVCIIVIFLDKALVLGLLSSPFFFFTTQWLPVFVCLAGCLAAGIMLKGRFSIRGHTEWSPGDTNRDNTALSASPTTLPLTWFLVILLVTHFISRQEIHCVRCVIMFDLLTGAPFYFHVQ